MQKAIVYFTLMFTMGLGTVMAQAPAGYQKGSITLASNEKIAGSIKDLQASKGSIVFMSVSGAKKTYSAAELIEFSVSADNFLSYANDFYKKIVSGSKANLYQKISDNSGKLIYNGSEAITATTTDGKVGDWYLQLKSDDGLVLVTKKNFEVVITNSFATCAVVIDEVKAKQLD